MCLFFLCIFVKTIFDMINEVRNTVLSVLNKNNYGYISPSDFNLFATNAQMEIFEDYFSNYNKAINMENTRSAGSDYAEIEGPIAETMETFLVAKFLSNSTGKFFLCSFCYNYGRYILLYIKDALLYKNFSIRINYKSFE
jgi:hypothetical protein